MLKKIIVAKIQNLVFPLYDGLSKVLQAGNIFSTGFHIWCKL